MEVFEVYRSIVKDFSCIVCKGNKCLGVDPKGPIQFSTIENVINELLNGRGWNMFGSRGQDEDVGSLLYTITKQSHPEYFI